MEGDTGTVLIVSKKPLGGGGGGGGAYLASRLRGRRAEVENDRCRCRRTVVKMDDDFSPIQPVLISPVDCTSVVDDADVQEFTGPLFLFNSTWSSIQSLPRLSLPTT